MDSGKSTWTPSDSSITGTNGSGAVGKQYGYKRYITAFFLSLFSDTALSNYFVGERIGIGYYVWLVGETNSVKVWFDFFCLNIFARDYHFF